MRKSFNLAFVTGQLLLAILLASGCGDDGPGIQPSIDGGGIVLPPESCDIATQDCTGADQKCTVALDDQNMTMPWSSVCRTAGTVALGEKCIREAEGAPGVGRDDCAKTLYCTAFGTLSGDVSPDSRRCRLFCRGGAACGAEEFCRPLTTNTAPIDGICIPKCTPITGTECTDGSWCVPISDYDMATVGECNKPGTATAGQPCSSEDMIECAANHICIVKMADPDNPVCAALCDAAGNLPCTAGLECQGLNGFPPDFGVCGQPVASDAGPRGSDMMLAPRK